MKFQEIDLTYDLIEGGIPIEIKTIFQFEFFERNLLPRYQKLSGENYLSFTPYGDYWEFIDEWKNQKVFGENGEVIENLMPYYESYSKGFLQGYFEFENEIKELNQIFNQNSLPIDKIFDEIKSSSGPFSTRGYYYPNDDTKQNPIPILDKTFLSKAGSKIGRNYKAWFYILKNPNPFVPLFREFYFEWFKFYEEEFRKWNSHILNYRSELQVVIDEIQQNLGVSPNTKKDSRKEITDRLLIDPKIIDPLFGGLKEYFKGKENELYSLLKGEKIGEKLYFPSNGNKLTDIFYRLHYHGRILNDKKVTAQWICDSFDNRNQKSKNRSEYKFDVVYKQLTNKDRGIGRSKRILNDL